MDLYLGGTGNGQVNHLATEPNGRSVTSLCGRTIWTSDKPLADVEADVRKTGAIRIRVCSSCLRAAKNVVV